MCRYGISGPYKRHFACFACRKAFKQPPIDDFLQSRGRGFVYKQLHMFWASEKALRRREQELGHRLADLEDEYRNATHMCPECRGEMIDMGLDFKPPPQSDAKAWQTLQGMYRIGHAFHTCGYYGPGWIPKSTSDYRKYLTSKKMEYGEQLKRVQKSAELSSEAKKEAGEFWASRIAAVEREQTRVG
jgi:hypothetical protein